MNSELSGVHNKLVKYIDLYASGGVIHHKRLTVSKSCYFISDPLTFSTFSFHTHLIVSTSTLNPESQSMSNYIDKINDTCLLTNFNHHFMSPILAGFCAVLAAVEPLH